MPIPNTQADIANTYFEYRDRLRALLFEVEEAVESIDNILQTPDPRKAFEALDALDQYRGRSGATDSLCFTSHRCDLDWPYLRDAVAEHDGRIATLEAAGKLAQFVDLSSAVKAGLTTQFQNLSDELEDDKTAWAKLDHDPATLAFRSVRGRLVKKGKKPHTGLYETTAHVWTGGRAKPSPTRVAEDLWHDLMTAVLQATCPKLFAEAD